MLRLPLPEAGITAGCNFAADEALPQEVRQCVETGPCEGPCDRSVNCASLSVLDILSDPIVSSLVRASRPKRSKVMAQSTARTDDTANKLSPGSGLGAFVRKARQDVSMSLRDVEEATNKEVSNGYLSQLESGKIAKPSPHVLHALSLALSVDYETLMKRAGYILPTAQSVKGPTPGRAETFAIYNLTADEEIQLLDYLSFLRAKKK